MTGRSNKSTLAQCHATDVSEHHTKISENPSTSYDEIMHSSGNDRQQLPKVNFFTFLIEFNWQPISGLSMIDRVDATYIVYLVQGAKLTFFFQEPFGS